MKRGQGPDYDDLSDLLNHMFGTGMPPGGGGTGDGEWGRRTANAIKEFEVSLEDLYKGKQVKMMSKRKVVCLTCKGYNQL